ncbi:MAG: DUF1385 domain-containing protein [Solirubrobacterales bacterium]|nr:DUF1385 domain-containing protein [Solirubrobacterales bacterium]MBV9717009.1 DUF1385 domain-containing protein [Solirubrobacterales bacterium]
MPDGARERRLTASRDAPVGGQAVLEGVMMRGISSWAVAVRKPADGAAAASIDVRSFPLASLRRRRLYRWPVVRGVVALAESLGIGLRALGISANAQLPEEEQSISGGAWTGTVVVALVFAVALFFVVPVGLTSLIKHQLGSSLLFWLVEGILRTGIFLGYLVLLSRVPDMKRVFQYHGAEHKVIACYEASDELTPARARLYSRLHPRCGTSFLLVVMIMAIFVFAPVGLPAWWLLVLTRILGVPLIAGLSFEVIRWAGRHRRRGWVRAVMYPGLQLQKLTTAEPDLDQLAVAIAALEAVLVKQRGERHSAADLLGVEVVA